MYRSICIVLILFSINCPVSAKSYIRDYEYKASEADSKLTSRANALDQVKLILLQEIGTHIRQKINITKDGSGNSYASEDVEAITAGLTKVEILEEEWNGEVYYLKAKIDADTDKVLEALEEFKKSSAMANEDKQALLENQRMLKQSRDEIAQLRKQLSEARSDHEKAKLGLKYKQQVDALSVPDMVNKGYGYEAEKDYIKAIYWYNQAAERGSAFAQYKTGSFYEYGYGVKTDYEQAEQWYRKAAENGDDSGQFGIGRFYRDGLGLEKNAEESVKWLRMAAEGGHRAAQNALGVAYAKGEGVEQDYEQAYKWYRKAAEQGHLLGEQNLALMYKTGSGVKQDHREALKWYRKSAEHGSAEATYQVGFFTFAGLGGASRDDVEAVKWFEKAAKLGQPDAQAYLGFMYQVGRGGLKKDVSTAVTWYERSAQLDSLLGKSLLASCYLDGTGVNKDLDKARELLEQSADSKNTYPYLLLAWNYAVCNFGCNGERAVFWGDKLLQTGRTAKNLDVVAAAYARAGDFKKAVDYEKEAIAMLSDDGLKNRYKKRLVLYQSNKPYTTEKTNNN